MQSKAGRSLSHYLIAVKSFSSAATARYPFAPLEALQKQSETIRRQRRHILWIALRRNEGAAMNDELARTASLAALIGSPTLVLVAMQLPLWLPPPRQAALAPVVYVHADFGPPCDHQEPTTQAKPVEASASACMLPGDGHHRLLITMRLPSRSSFPAICRRGS